MAWATSSLPVPLSPIDDHRGLALGGLLGEFKDLLHEGGFPHQTLKVAGGIHELGEMLDLLIPLVQFRDIGEGFHRAQHLPGFVP